RIYTKEESARLLEPWLGSGLPLAELPVPRIVAVRIAGGEAPDFIQLRTVLTEQVPTASLDDHRGFVERMRAMARAAFIGGLAVLALVLVAPVLSVALSARGAVAPNRSLGGVLHLIGAQNSFFSRSFHAPFLRPSVH